MSNVGGPVNPIPSNNGDGSPLPKVRKTQGTMKGTDKEHKVSSKAKGISASKIHDLSSKKVSEGTSTKSSNSLLNRVKRQLSDLRLRIWLRINPEQALKNALLKLLQDSEQRDRLSELLESHFQGKDAEFHLFLNSPDIESAIVTHILDEFSKMKPQESEGFDPRIVYLGELGSFLRQLGMDENLLDSLVVNPRLKSSLPALFQQRELIEKSPWKVAEQIYILSKNQGGYDLIAAANNSKDGFAKSRITVDGKGFSVIAYRDDNRKVHVYLSSKVLGEGSFKKAKLLLNLEEGEKSQVKLNPKVKTSEGGLVKKKEGKFKKEVTHEAIISKELQEEGVPYVLKIREVTYTSTQGVQKVRGMTEVCSQGDLHEAFFKKDQKLSQDEKLRLMGQVCEGLAGMHKVGICHLDLKLANVFLTENQSGDLEARVADFGAAKHIKHDTFGVNTTHLSATFPPPEMLDSDEIPVSPSIDSWALGVMLYEATHGVSASKLKLSWNAGMEDRDSYNAAIEKIRDKLANGNELDQIICKMLSTNPEERATPEDALKCIKTILSKRQQDKSRSLEPEASAVFTHDEASSTRNISSDDKEPLTKKREKSFFSKAWQKWKTWGSDRAKSVQVTLRQIKAKIFSPKVEASAIKTLKKTEPLNNMDDVPAGKGCFAWLKKRFHRAAS